MKVGLLAGTGALPKAVAEGAKALGHDVYLAQIEGMPIADLEGKTYHFGEVGKILKDFRAAGVTHVCMAGNVGRPDLTKIRPDFQTLKRLPGAIKAARQGDDSLLKYVVSSFEKEGFEIIAPQELCSALLMPSGHLGAHRIEDNDREDAEKAMRIAREIGAMDIGQAVVVCRGLVLAVEAQEGTDGVLKRVANLPSDIRGRNDRPAGVLAKMVKPGQEDRVDLPTIGPKTVKLAADAGLAGIITEAGQAFVIDRGDVAKLADAAGMFVVGLPPSES